MIGATTTGTTPEQERELGIGHHQHDDAAEAHKRVAQRHRGRRGRITCSDSACASDEIVMTLY